MEGNKSTNSLADPALLEAIDKLFELGIGEYVALPQVSISVCTLDPLAKSFQLLVIGDQSSGKSSVLEGLTGLSYPRDSTLCTRFATQITFRRAPIQKIAISVIPAIESEPSYAEKLRKWKRDDLKEFDSQAFVKILKEVRRPSSLMSFTSSTDADTMESRRSTSLWASQKTVTPSPEPKSRLPTMFSRLRYVVLSRST